jgi:hypothetical protein
MADFDPNVSQSAPATSAPDSGSAVTTPTPAIQGTPAAQPATHAAPGTAPDQGGTQAPATGAPGEGWVPSWRLRETRENVLKEARGFFETKEQEFKRREEELQSKIAALAGFGPKPNPEVTAVRDQFGNLYPGLSKLEQQADTILQLLEKAGEMESSTSHYWQSYGQGAVNKLFSSAEKDLGAPLSDEAKHTLYSSFEGYIRSSPELTNMYASDPTFPEKYWKAFSSSFIDPVRRVSAASAQTRAGVPVPQDTPASAPRVGQPQKPGSLDERVNQSWTAYQQSKTK